MAHNIDPNAVLREWRDRQDIEKAAFESRAILNRILESDEPMSEKLAQARCAAEAIFDGPGMKPLIMRQAMDLLAKEWRWHEWAYETTFEERTRMRVEIEVLRARSLHTGGDSRLALEHCIAAHNEIEKLAGGRNGLLTALTSHDPNRAAELLVAILGIFAAALKRGLPRGCAARRYWTGEIRTLADSYLAGLKLAPDNIYPGAPSLVQVMYLLCEEGDPADGQRIEGLRALDVLVRPSDKRAEATIPLREIAVARYRGDIGGVKLLSPRVGPNLKAQGLGRHLWVVYENNYAE